MSKTKIKEPKYINSAINTNMLNYRVYVMSPIERIIYFLFLFIVGGIVGYIFYGNLFQKDGVSTLATYISNTVVFSLFGIIANKVFMKSLCSSLCEKRKKKLSIQFRDFLSSLSTSLSGGMNIKDSIDSTYNDLVMQYTENSLIVKEVGEMINAQMNNVPFEQSIEDFGKRSGIADIENFANVFAICMRTGGNFKEIVRRTNDIINEKMIINEEIQTKLTSNKMQLRAMNVIPIVIVGVMKGMSSQFAEGFTTVVGVAAITVALGVFVAAYKIGNRIMDVKE